MKTLLLLRHGKSSWGNPGQRDFDRPLKDRGRKDAALIGAYLQTIGCVPNVIISSPALRARQTADCLAEAVAGSTGAETDYFPDIYFDKRLYEAPTEAILRVARSAGDEPAVLMLVGHNPSMQMAALKLWGEGKMALRDALLRGYPTAGLASVAFATTWWSDISWSGATPLGFISPLAVKDGLSGGK